VPKRTHKGPPVQDTTDNELTLTNEQAEENHFVTTEEIEKERLPPEEILSLPMFMVNQFVYYVLY
jgi:U11/U12 small nuclear ribonucleoprotein 65 kDa protein